MTKACTWTGSVSGGVLNVMVQDCGATACSNPVTFNGSFAFQFP